MIHRVATAHAVARARPIVNGRVPENVLQKQASEYGEKTLRSATFERSVGTGEEIWNQIIKVMARIILAWSGMDVTEADDDV